MSLVGFTDGQQAFEVPGGLYFDAFLDLPDSVGDVAHHFNLREVYRVDLGGAEADVHHFGPTTDHEEGRLLDHVVADIDDQVG
ncbi:hypothetical protein D3C71_2076280 [compost metagenome]